jgi:hypothetical protein
MMRMPTSKTKEVCQAPQKKNASESVGRKFSSLMQFSVIEAANKALWVGRKEHSTASAIR